MEKQDFFAIRRDCYEKGIFFEDIEFPPNNSLLPLIDSSGNPKKFDKWMRPHEICRNPKFFVNNFSRFDIKQGKIGDCWFLAAVTSLTLNPHLFKRVVCSSNSFDQEYAGIFHFHFWHNDKWESVVIDDRLPTYNNKLVYASSTDENEFWIALLEKAFAKFKGSYKGLSEYGTMCEAAADLTGGISDKFCPKQGMDAKPHCGHMHVCFDKLEKSFMCGNFMGCLMRSDDKKSKENKTKEHLVRGHAFSITSVKRFYIEKFENDEIQLFRLRNPWGSSYEWTGAWCDTCPKWNDISNELKIEMGYKNLEDGEFWMSYEDFQKHFDVVEICSLSAQTLLNLTEECHMKMRKNVINCKLVEKDNGKLKYCVNELVNDPRCIIKIEKNSTVIVSVFQTNVRKLMMNHPKLQHHLFPMGLLMIKISENTKHFFLQNEISINELNKNEMKELVEAYRTPTSTHRFHDISPGKYIVIPYTVHQNANFHIQVYSATEISLKFKKIQICMKLFEKLWISRSSRC